MWLMMGSNTTIVKTSKAYNFELIRKTQSFEF